jgi:hypothetical protein
VLATLGLLAAGAAWSGPAAGAAVTQSQRAADLRLAEKALIPKSALPGIGWTASGSNVSSGGWPTGSAGAAFATCVGVPQTVLDVNPPDVVSPAYENNVEDISVDEEVQAFASPQAAAADIGVSANPKTPGCERQFLASSYGASFTNGLAQAMGSGTSVGTLTVTHQPAPAYGTESAAFLIALPLINGSTHVTVYVDNVSIGRGRLEAGLSFLSAGKRFPTKTAEALEKAAARSLRA